jgi:hypothetical protein
MKRIHITVLIKKEVFGDLLLSLVWAKEISEHDAEVLDGLGLI